LRLVGKIYGSVIHPNNLNYNNGQSLKNGCFVKGIKIHCSSLNENYILRDCLIDKPTFQPIIGQNTSFEAELILTSIVRKSNIEGKVYSLIDWHICSSPKIIFPRITTRIPNTKPFKYRYDIDKCPDTNELIISSGFGISRDFFILQVKELKIIIQKIEKKYLPDWSCGIAIEYRGDISTLPDSLTRKEISVFISFIFGIQLLSIGSTHYDLENKPIVSFGNSPWGNNAISICNMNPRPPFHYNNNEIEKTLSILLEKFLLVCNKFNLSETIWKLWIGREQPIGTNLPIYASGIETLGDKYLKEKNIINKKSKTDNKKYNELIQDEYDSLSIKLKDYQFGKFVLNKLKNPTNYGIGEKMKLFFESLGFNFDENSVESKAMQARNEMTHESLSEISDTRIEKFVRNTNAYITLYNRLILKLLDYNGKYIDYYNFGHPLRGIDENINIEE